MTTPRICACVRHTSLVSRTLHTTTSSQPRACRRWLTTKRASVLTRCYSTEVIPPPSIEGQEKEYAPKIKDLVKDISQLTLLEVADLNELLKKTLNITDTPVMAMGAAAAAPVKAEEEEEEEADTKHQKTFFAVKLTGFDAAKKVALIKEIKTLVPGMNLVQAKKFVESTPQVVQGDLTQLEADDLKKALDAAGGKTEIE